ncbi:MAG: hypothetical protein NC311_06435 [Muribaculaceae bacterium]|nr:hypothetical protein [Muribaculaceae bacterium]
MEATDITKEQRENLTKMWEYIKNNYPDSCIAGNYKLNGQCPDNSCDHDLIDMCSSFFLFEILPICGCGLPEITMETICDYLDIVEIRHTKSDDPMNRYSGFDKARKLLREKYKVEYESDDPLLQFLAYAMDEVGLTEHGSSIHGAWITDLGRMCKYALRLRLAEELSDEGEEEGERIGSIHIDPSSGKTRDTTSRMSPDSTEPGTSDSHVRFRESIKYFLNYIESFKTSKAIPLPIGALDYDGDPDACITEAQSLWVTLVCMFGEPVNGKAEYGYINKVEACIGYLKLMEEMFEG